MKISRTASVFAATLIALSLAACTTTKKPTATVVVEENAADKAAAEKAAADRAAADKAAADKAAADAAAEKAAADKAAADAAATASAASTANDINSQALADEKASKASKLSNQLSELLTIKVFHFDFDSANITTADYPALKAHAAYLSKNSSARLQVSGHTDERGTREYNMALGERRAKTVAAFLTSNGAKSAQLEVVSYGQEKPVSANSSEEDWAQNRRAELEYTAK